jgi:transcriptional regulator with XRE-family HTH domain
MTRAKFEALWAKEGAARLRLARMVLGITEIEAAAAAGIALPAYRRWEGGAAPGIFSMLRFAGKYGLSLDWLFVGDGQGLRCHLTTKAHGKLAILPTTNSKWRVAREAVRS